MRAREAQDKTKSCASRPLTSDTRTRMRRDSAATMLASSTSPAHEAGLRREVRHLRQGRRPQALHTTAPQQIRYDTNNGATVQPHALDSAADLVEHALDRHLRVFTEGRWGVQGGGGRLLLPTPEHLPTATRRVGVGGTSAGCSVGRGIYHCRIFDSGARHAKQDDFALGRAHSRGRNRSRACWKRSRRGS